VLLATFSNALRPLWKPSPPSPHFDPFGTEFGEPGRGSHSEYFRFKISDLRLNCIYASQSEI